MRKVVVIAAAVALALAVPASAGTHFVKLASGSDESEYASVSLLTLYPLLAAGQKPYTRFAVTLVSRPAQALRLSYRVQCSNGVDEATRSYPARRLAATRVGARYALKTPMVKARYCSVSLVASGAGYVKATLLGSR